MMDNKLHQDERAILCFMLKRYGKRLPIVRNAVRDYVKIYHSNQDDVLKEVWGK